MPVTKEPHRSSGATCATITPIDVVIDAVRCAHQHPTFTGIAFVIPYWQIIIGATFKL